MRGEIDVVVLDVGRVIVDYDFDRAYEVWSRALGVAPAALREGIRQDETAFAFERGRIDPEAYVHHLALRLGRSMSLAEFESGWNAIFTDLVPGISELVPRVADRVRLFALSNTNATHARYWKARYAPVFERFERVFCSHELRARKPERAAYAAIADYANVSPHRIAFFDDIPEFVEGARQFGFRSFLAEGCGTIEAPLVRLGVLPSPQGSLRG